MINQIYKKQHFKSLVNISKLDLRILNPLLACPSLISES